MKFGEKLGSHLTPEWREQYIKYHILKAMLIQAIEQAPPADDYDVQVSRSYYQQFEDQFMLECQAELEKINSFFAEKLAECKRKHQALARELSRYVNHPSMFNVDQKQQRKLKDFKFDFSESYLSLVLLQNYQVMNHTGFRKILKKHDKMLHTDSGLKWFQNNVETAPFYTDRQLKNLITETEDLFTVHLAGGDRSNAMKRLRVPPLDEIQHPWTTFRLGFYLGVLLVLLWITTYMYLVKPMSENNLTAFIILYRAPLLFIVHLFLLGFNVYGWRKAGINHILIFEIDPRDHLTHSHLMAISAGLAALWALCVLAFLISGDFNWPPFVFPVILLAIIFAFICNPFRIFHYSSRVWLIQLVVRVCCAPFFHVGFADFWLGDQLNSLASSCLDYGYTICFYATNGNLYDAVDPEYCRNRKFVMNAIVECLPAWFRFAQCLRRFRDTHNAYPYLLNAGKYSMTFLCVFFATMSSINAAQYDDLMHQPYFWCYLICRIIATVYCYAYDVIRDFGLFKKFKPPHIFLHDQIVYPSVFYYFAIIENLLLRCFWAIPVFLYYKKYVASLHLTTVSAFLEVFRRYIWNYLRLEHEHLYNCGKFRAVRDISVTPLQVDDVDSLELMMDDIVSVTTRRRRKPQSSVNYDSS